MEKSSSVLRKLSELPETQKTIPQSQEHSMETKWEMQPSDRKIKRNQENPGAEVYNEWNEKKNNKTLTEGLNIRMVQTEECELEDRTSEIIQ